jgi:hypothetical protein
LRRGRSPQDLAIDIDDGPQHARHRKIPGSLCRCTPKSCSQRRICKHLGEPLREHRVLCHQAVDAVGNNLGDSPHSGSHDTPAGSHRLQQDEWKTFMGRRHQYDIDSSQEVRGVVERTEKCQRADVIHPSSVGPQLGFERAIAGNHTAHFRLAPPGSNNEIDETVETLRWTKNRNGPDNNLLLSKSKPLTSRDAPI